MVLKINRAHLAALNYVRKAEGATVEQFCEDHEPVGTRLWSELFNMGLVMVAHGTTCLTIAGEQQVNANG